ncbi:hypothetical protein GCWU000325_01722 [Alloprevotella tannerae ATCC 51259]|uniref:Uncharacterized protein n=1 Tax=Alloprevotella tannerae ATCC 51259 TaxID=626522 RepID=C9LHQ6_9BACT|nr:hypothetical protein GCWU000325_01722 [Alloprevotella tannerae ATCC 51259]
MLEKLTTKATHFVSKQIGKFVQVAQVALLYVPMDVLLFIEKRRIDLWKTIAM